MPAGMNLSISMESDHIIFLLRHRHQDLDKPKPIPIESEFATSVEQMDEKLEHWGI